MSKRLPAVGGAFMQGEDELASIFAVVGASLAGAKAMTATASAGFNYKQEGIGYASAIEAPCVIVDVQRCRGENFASQADVMQMRWGASGDYETICLAPSSVQELFDYTIKAFNLAETFRNPVVIMSETTIALMRERLAIPEAKKIQIINRTYTKKRPGDYMTFQAAENQVPEFSPLGKGYHNLYSINPHDERGGIDWDPETFDKLYKRITGKISENKDRICETQSYHMEDATLALIAYGSEVRPALDAVELARAEGIKAGLLKLVTVWPVPEKAIREVAGQVGAILSVEMNIGKYSREIERVSFGRCPVHFVTKNKGSGHTKEEIYQAIKEVWK